MMHIDNADQLSAGYQRDRQKSLVSVLRQGLKRLETGVRGGIGRQRHHRLVKRDPSRDSFPHLQADLSDLRVMRQLGSAQYDFPSAVIRQIDQAGVTGRHLKSQRDQLLQHCVQRQIGADDIADPM